MDGSGGSEYPVCDPEKLGQCPTPVVSKQSHFTDGATAAKASVVPNEGNAEADWMHYYEISEQDPSTA